jgi:serine/threonine protein kinase
MEKKTTAKLDMWALGIILYQLVASNKNPFEKEDDKNNLFALINNIQNKDPAPLPESVSPLIKKTVKALLEKNPDSRPDA